MIDPIIANSAPKRKNVVIGGHMRLRAAKELGNDTVPVVYVSIPNVKKEKELNLRLNRNTGEWDFSKLKAFDMELLLDIGFDDGDLTSIWEDSLETEDDGFDFEEAVKAVKKPKAKKGDLYALGAHRLLCGDSLDPESAKRLLGKKQAEMIYCDPPYNIALDYDKGVGGKGSYGGKVNDAKSDAEYRSFLKRTMENALAAAKPDAHAYYWCDQKYIGLVQELFAELGLDNKRVCLWIKGASNPTPGVAFNKCYEPCVYATRGKPYLSPVSLNLSEVLNKEMGPSGNKLLDDIMDQSDIWLAKRVSGADYQHPTQKPVTLHERPLKRCTKPGDSVLDLFGGSGSTLMACEAMKRICYTVEAEPVFVDVIIERYEKATGSKARKLA
jgi:DNA modification methylase